MPATLTTAGETTVAELAARYHVSTGAVRALLDAVIRGGGSMAQFSHPELGGSGQWLRGGMTMVGDMFNSGLQSTVNGICSELSSQLAGGAQLVAGSEPVTRSGSSGGFAGNGNLGGGDWWPAGLGRPSSSGGQNDSAYAYFPSTRRLAIRRGGAVTLYDTGDHQISGVQQQQGGRGSLEFSSQRGTFTVDTLQEVTATSASAQSAQPERPAQPELPAQPERPAPPEPEARPAVERPSPTAVQTETARATSGGASTAAEIGSAIETLAGLRDKGLLTEDEFSAKKIELLARL